MKYCNYFFYLQKLLWKHQEWSTSYVILKVLSKDDGSFSANGYERYWKGIKRGSPVLKNGKLVGIYPFRLMYSTIISVNLYSDWISEKTNISIENSTTSKFNVQNQKNSSTSNFNVQSLLLQSILLYLLARFFW